jgi:hypothetical protein
MGLLDLLAAGYLAKRAHNKLNPPVIVSPPDFDVIGIKPRGLREYEIKYRKKGSTVTQVMFIGRNTTSMSGGWEFHWK